MNLDTFRKHNIPEEWMPYLEQLYKDGRVHVEGIPEANMVKDIVHSFTQDIVSIEYMENKLYVMFTSELELGGSE